MSLADIKAFADLRAQGDDTFPQRQLLLSHHANHLRQEIQRLTTELHIVDYKIAEYSEKIP